MTRDEKVRAITDQYTKVYELASERLPDYVIMTPEEYEDVTRQLLSTRAPYARKKKPPAYEQHPLANAYARMLSWHHSGGDLTGLMMLKFQASEDVYEKAENTVAVVLAATGARSSAVSAWQRTGLFS